MLKKILSVSLTLILMLTLVPSYVFAVVINEDVTVSAPLNEDMETTSNLAAITAQLTSSGKDVRLSSDSSQGDFSWQITTTSETAGYAQYALVNSSSFNVADYSTIRIWVKPGNGASWVSFYSNNALITSDKDGNGKFEVGSDLTSGKWTLLTLDLLNTNQSITTGQDLVVQSNDNSIWKYDEIKSQGTISTSIDLSTMLNSATTLNNGMLQFNKTGDELAYITTPTTLVSNRSGGIEKIFDKQTDFAGGTFFNCVGQADGSIVGSTPIESVDGTAIGYGHNPSSAFDSSTSTYWSSGDSVALGKNTYYIGYDFGTPKTINCLSLCTTSEQSVSSVYIQYYNDLTGQWVTIGTAPIKGTSDTQCIGVPTITTSKIILIEADYNSIGGGQYWNIYDLKFYNTQFSWSYTSSEINISTSNTIDISSLNYTASTSAITVETSLSVDGGTTWQSWTELNKDEAISGINNKTNLQNAKIKYRLSGTKTDDAGIPVIYSVKLLLQGNETSFSAISGKVSDIKINCNVNDISGNASATYSTSHLSALQGKDICAISGNGKLAFYKNTAAGYLYSVDLSNGYTTATTVPLNKNMTVKSNYDGTVIACFGSTSNIGYLYKYDSKATQPLTTIPKNNLYSFDIQNNGEIVYSFNVDSSQKISFISPANVTTSWQSDVAYGLAIAENSQNYCYYNSNVVRVCNGRTYLGSYTASTGIIGNTFLNANGDTAYFVVNNYLCSYSITTKTFRQYNISGTLMTMLDGDKLLVLNLSGKYIIYDPATNSSTDITPSDYSSVNGLFLIDNAGQTAIYSATDGTRISYLNAFDKVCKYLLSFDGKNTWYSYSSGAWQKVYTGKTPDTATLTKYGMTADQVNALTSSDFATLYDDGNEIFTVNFAVYFNSVSPNYTPSISSIKIITDADKYDDASGTTANPLFAAKKEDFSGSGWRKVNRIYPVEIGDKASDTAFFIYVDGAYIYYDGTGWVSGESATIADLIANLDSGNWATLAYYGMTAEDVRRIPQSALTSKLAFKDFSVVYCLRVPDVSTVGYNSLINIDYVAELYSSESLTLNITYSNGTTEQIAGMTRDQIENFMEWLLIHTKNTPSFISFKVGNVNYYINYKDIEKVSVTEN